MSEISIYDFIAWCTGIINPSRLSDLMSTYGYTDDSAESIIDAFVTEPEFTNDFGVLLGEGLAEQQKELNRAIGGVSSSNDNLTISDWKWIISQQELTLALGDPAVAGAKPAFDWNNLVTSVFGAVGSIFSGKAADQQATQVVDNSTATKTSGSSIAIYIIIAVVVLVVIAIAWMALSANKK